MAAMVFGGALLLGTLAACASNDRQLTEDDRQLSEEGAALMADEKYGDETFESADLGGQMEIDDSQLRIAVTSLNGKRGQLLVEHESNPELNKAVEVEFLTVFTVGEYRIKVVTIDDRGIALRWAKEQ